MWAKVIEKKFDGDFHCVLVMITTASTICFRFFFCGWERERESWRNVSTRSVSIKIRRIWEFMSLSSTLVRIYVSIHIIAANIVSITIIQQPSAFHRRIKMGGVRFNPFTKIDVLATSSSFSFSSFAVSDSFMVLLLALDRRGKCLGVEQREYTFYFFGLFFLIAREKNQKRN